MWLGLGVIAVTGAARSAAKSDGADAPAGSPLATRVEQAKGILAERLGIDPEVAFTRLRRYGRQHGLHLAELSRRVVGGSFTLEE